MNFTSRPNYIGDAGVGGNYQLLSAYETSSSFKGEDYPSRPSLIRRHSSRNVLLKAERRKKCTSPACVCLASPSTPRSLLPKGGTCECALDSLPYLPRDSGASMLPRDLYSALEELELESSLKDYQSRGRHSIRTLTRYESEAPQNESSSPRSRLLRRLKLPSSGRRGARSDRSVMRDTELSPTSSASSSRYGSPVSRRSPTPFTPRNAEADMPTLYYAQQPNPPLRVESVDLDEDMSPAGTEPLGQEGREQGKNGSKGQDPLAMRFKMPDSMLGHNSRKYSRLP